MEADIVFNSSHVTSRLTRKKGEATRKQKTYVRSLLKDHPSLGEPVDWSMETVSKWITTAREALGADNAPSGVSSRSDNDPLLDLSRELLGHSRLTLADYM